MKLPRLPRRPKPQAADRDALTARRRTLTAETRLFLAAKVLLCIGAVTTIYAGTTAAEPSVMPGLLFLLFVCMFLVIDIVAGNVYAHLEQVDEDLAHLDALARVEDPEYRA